jgi:hypothetical protein
MMNKIFSWIFTSGKQCKKEFIELVALWGDDWGTAAVFTLLIFALPILTWAYTLWRLRHIFGG